MSRILRPVALLAALGVTAGLMLAVIGLPYGRINHSAFAELYHGPTDTTGTIHFAIDCSPTTQTDDECGYLLFNGDDPFQSASVTVGNSTGAAVTIGAFGFTVRTEQDVLTPDDIAGTPPYLDGNPDVNEADLGPGWNCGPPEPDPDINPDPNVADAFLGCFNPPSIAVLQPGEQHFTLATVFYDMVTTISASTDLELVEASIYDEALAELGSCRPIINVESPCIDSHVSFNFHQNVTPTHTPHVFPTPTNTPIPDMDDDGVLNTNDNCPLNANPGQENTDRNFIINAPSFAQNDLTRAHSDTLGDACDDDDDNDGVTDQVEMLHCPYGMWPTNPLAFDTDGDRFHDGAECGLYTDATRSDSKPLVSACGLTTDGDNDGLKDRIEYCFYNTNPAVADTDGDGVKDGCEAASFNNDTIVNVADLGMLATEISRAVPASQKVVNLDVNKDGAYNPADLGMVAARVGKCP